MSRRRRLDLFHDEIISRIISCVAIHRLHVNNTAHSSAAHHRPQPPLPATSHQQKRATIECKIESCGGCPPSPPSTPSNSICLHTGTGCLSPIAWWRSCSEERSVTRNYRHLLPWPEERWQWRRRRRRRWRTAPLNNAPRTMRHLRKSDFFSMATQDRVEVQRVCIWNPDLSSHEQSENRERGEEPELPPIQSVLCVPGTPVINAWPGVI